MLNLFTGCTDKSVKVYQKQKPLCPCPPETKVVNPALVDGGIFGNQRICKALSDAIDEICSGLDMDAYPEAYQAVDLLSGVINRLDNSFTDCQSMIDCSCCGNEVTEYEIEVWDGVCSNCYEADSEHPF